MFSGNVTSTVLAGEGEVTYRIVNLEDRYMVHRAYSEEECMIEDEIDGDSSEEDDYAIQPLACINDAVTIEAPDGTHVTYLFSVVS